MTTVGVFEARQKLSELVERARRGEEIGITRRGTLGARLGPVQPPLPCRTWKEFFDELEEYRKHAPLLKNPPIEEWIDEGHR